MAFHQIEGPRRFDFNAGRENGAISSLLSVRWTDYLHKLERQGHHKYANTKPAAVRASLSSSSRANLAPSDLLMGTRDPRLR